MTPPLEAPPPTPPASTCSLCGTALEADATRCPVCGLWQTAHGRPNPFRGAALWVLISGIAVVYVAALLVVAVAR